MKQYEYELLLLTFLLLRFFFKNFLGVENYFTEQPILGLSEKSNFILGAVVLIIVCIYLSSKFGRLIRSNESTFEKPILILFSLFFACPASLPFLFNTAILTGTQMLYPFAVFALCLFLISKPFIKWLVPIICALYFIPALHSSEVLFSVLRKGAILYVPLILLLLYLDMIKNQIEPGKKKTKRINIKSDSTILFFISLFVSICSYLYSLNKGTSYCEGFYREAQKLNGYLLISLLITAPVLVALGIVIYHAIKNKFPKLIFGVLFRASALLFLLYKNNYYGLWIPFVILSLFIIIFYGVQQKNPAMLSAVQRFGEFCLKHQFSFFIILMVMVSFSNVSSTFLSVTIQKIFNILPY